MSNLRLGRLRATSGATGQAAGLPPRSQMPLGRRSGLGCPRGRIGNLNAADPSLYLVPGEIPPPRQQQPAPTPFCFLMALVAPLSIRSRERRSLKSGRPAERHRDIRSRTALVTQPDRTARGQPSSPAGSFSSS